ncbi:MAG TPA: HTTM domain-containing protein, partial [Polyangia bacterium]|nr:HTTM domain-containing protein [Polyangia bacterium]
MTDSMPSSTTGSTLRQALVRAYLTVDPRSLGLGRIALALVLLLDLLRRIPGLGLWYSNDGLLPNHMMLWRPPTQWMFSLFFLASWTDEAAVGFVICGLVYLALLIGWRTRLFQVLALIALWSLHSRVTFVENGGDWMLGELTLWTAFLPLGRRFSVDAVLAARRSLPSPPPPSSTDGHDDGAVISVAVLALLVQLAVSYLFNALHKGGMTWRQGSAVHMVLHQDRMVTAFGVWMRPHMTPLLSRALSYGSLVMEGLLPALILSPWRQTVTRRLAVVFIIALHVGLQLFINVGVFSWTMIAYGPFLLTPADWQALDTRSWLATLGGRLSARTEALVVRISRACRPSSTPARTSTLAVNPGPESPAVQQLRRLLTLAREGAAALMLVVLLTELFIGNPLLSTKVRLWQPGWVKALVAYPRLIQAWTMFAPDAPTVDETVV